MWLLHPRTLKLEYFEGNQVPTYAILSHRWESEEVTFQDVKHKKNRHKKGWRKVKSFCKMVAATYGVRRNDKVYCWVDTCCIDKSNSAELSEAINSMWRWYQEATICYAYLPDVVHEGIGSIQASFRKSVWFTRCWTLQELIAPQIVQFLDQNWQSLGNRFSLSGVISEVTGINLDCLRYGYKENRDGYSILERMSWAAGRQSTRIEDEAYSLLGIFDVNMPLIYGEGRKAFIRLQEEILKYSNDQTMFSWGRAGLSPPGVEGFSNPRQYKFEPSPLLYHSPDVVLRRFDLSRDAGSGQNDYSIAKDAQPTTISGTEVAISMYLVPHSRNIYFALVGMLPYDTQYVEYSVRAERSQEGKCSACRFQEKEQHQCILLARDEKDGRFRRCIAEGKYVFDAPPHWQAYGKLCRIVLDRSVLSVVSQIIQPAHLMYGMRVESIRMEEVAAEDVSLISYAPIATLTSLVMKVGTYGVAGTIVFARPQEFLKILLCGFDFDFNPFCLLIVPEQCDQRPEHVRIAVPDLDLTNLDVTQNCYMMELVKRMMKSNKRFWEPTGDCVELHCGSWADATTIFQVTGIGQVQLSAQFHPQFGLGIQIFPSKKKKSRGPSLHPWLTDEHEWYNLAHGMPLKPWYDSKSLPRSWAKVRGPENLPRPLVEVLPDDHYLARIPRRRRSSEAGAERHQQHQQIRAPSSNDASSDTLPPLKSDADFVT